MTPEMTIAFALAIFIWTCAYMALRFAWLQHDTAKALKETAGLQHAILEHSQNQFIMSHFFLALPPKEKARLARAIMTVTTKHRNENVDEEFLLKEIINFFNNEGNDQRINTDSFI